MSVPGATQLVNDLNVINYWATITGDNVNMTNLESVIADDEGSLAIMVSALASEQAALTSAKSALNSYLVGTYAMSSGLATSISVDTTVVGYEATLAGDLAVLTTAQAQFVSDQVVLASYLVSTYSLDSGVATSTSQDVNVIDYEASSDQTELISYLVSTYSIDSNLATKIVEDTQVSSYENTLISDWAAITAAQTQIASDENVLASYLVSTYSLVTGTATSVSRDVTVINNFANIATYVIQVSNTEGVISDVSSGLVTEQAQLITYQGQLASDKSALVSYLISIGQPGP